VHTVLGHHEITPDLVIIDDFHIIRVAVLPAETQTVLLIDADAVLAVAIPPERFQFVSHRDFQIIQGLGFIQQCQFPLGSRRKRLITFNRIACKKALVSLDAKDLIMSASLFLFRSLCYALRNTSIVFDVAYPQVISPEKTAIGQRWQKFLLCPHR